MADSTYPCKPNLCPSSPNAAEMGEPVDPEPACRPSYLPMTPDSILDEIKVLWQGAGGKAECRPDKGQKKSWSKRPKNHATGGNADPTARRTWGAFDPGMAYHVVIDQWLQLIRRPYHAEADGSSCQGHVIPARGGLSHG
jgi:hypothetical protein